MTANANGGKADAVHDVILASLAKAAEYNHVGWGQPEQRHSLEGPTESRRVIP